MNYSVYFDDGKTFNLVGIYKNKTEAESKIQEVSYTNHEAFYKRWKHLTKKQIEKLHYAQAVFFESCMEESNGIIQ